MQKSMENSGRRRFRFKENLLFVKKKNGGVENQTDTEFSTDYIKTMINIVL